MAPPCSISAPTHHGSIPGAVLCASSGLRAAATVLVGAPTHIASLHIRYADTLGVLRPGSFAYGESEADIYEAQFRPQPRARRRRRGRAR